VIIVFPFLYWILVQTQSYCFLETQGSDTIIGGTGKCLLLHYVSGHCVPGLTLMFSPTGEDVLFGDYGLVMWVDHNDNVVARAGGGGHGDFTDGQDRSIRRIIAVHPNETDQNETLDGYYDLLPGTDRVYGNEARDVLVGGGGENDTLHGNDGSDFILGDYGVLEFNTSAPSLYGIRMIETLNCAQGEGGAENNIYGHGGDGEEKESFLVPFVKPSALSP